MKTFKPLKLEDFELTPKEKALIVKGAQRFLPPQDEDGEPIDKSKEPNTSSLYGRR